MNLLLSVFLYIIVHFVGNCIVVCCSRIVYSFMSNILIYILYAIHRQANSICIQRLQVLMKMALQFVSPEISRKRLWD